MIDSTTSTKPWRRRAQVAVPVLTLAVALVGCSRGDTTDDGTVQVAAIVKGLDNPFFQAMEDGLISSAEESGTDVTVQAAADISDTVGQADKLTALGVQDYNCYVVNPISGTNLVQTLTLMASPDKPVVNIDSPLDPEAIEVADLDVATYIGTDNKAAGGKAGAFIVSEAGPNAEVAVVGGIAGDVTSAARIDGFKAAVAGQVDIVQEVAADWKREVALTKATDILAANPNVKAFFAANDDMGLGIVKAVENAGLTGKVVVVSVDGNKDALESVAGGGLSATVAQYPYTIGALGLQACEAAAAGIQLPDTIESPTALVTRDDAESAIAQFPRPFEAFDNPLETLLASSR
ncbi:substrate-binding domain-containing protein [Antrihabitans sp. YC2-6]|uniref:substrate-binding domain-containing protein n=1 Tax=Antrihabitans sp. YC2-6 TaxID=2799498 RepID=UPI0018F76628|nr:substrate-binding domain-containing protein [Antrihabitans sp. YC2-6]MBJ8344336.1 substrate-binding domain-containing protein [Antrihabitans sp. YC2-6]